MKNILKIDFNFLNFFWAFKNSLIQGIGTVAICCFLGCVFAFGYLDFSLKIRKYIRFACLIPYILPTLFSILIALNSFTVFPFGHIGVIFIFSMMHLGFSVIFLAEVIETKLSQPDLVSKVYGISRKDFYFQIAWPIVRKDFLVLAIFIFLSCFTSLSVPLIAGGGRGTNIEVYIYEKIFIEQKWAEAIYIFVIQFFILFIFSKFILVPNNKEIRHKNLNIYTELRSKFAKVGLIIFIGYYFLNYLFKAIDTFLKIETKSVFDLYFFKAWLNSMIIFIGLIVGFNLFLIIKLFFKYKDIRLNLGSLFLYPSTLFVGFGLYLIFPSVFAGSDYLKTILGIAFLYMMSLYQTYFFTNEDQIENQFLVCRVYNISFLAMIKNIFWVQFRSKIIFVYSLLYLISISEFAFLKASFIQIQTLGTLTQLYINSYRLNQAYVISVFSLVSWIFSYFFLRALFYVDYKKIKFYFR